ncbi:2-phospho-L-lactate guanylyltransferase [Halogranum amylolyticum]|uniref:2-phospho-L-lactate guanylyltransferase n=1 Tax=Halogranum amylolyticum TaxID=660520 RepID=A0A1H8N953_9EURY|nr:2-phospho-L-lactate guanylyltransferase [Halogranum amylolyticum]SEO26066.1 2-phospho-L-lactate guanylyltransferase [Halogranum amylolyticum]
MRVVVPFATEQPKTRLSDVLSPDERRAFARAMLSDVLTAVRAAGHDPLVVATAPLDEPTTGRLDADASDATSLVQIDASVRVDDSPLSTAVNATLAAAVDPVAVVMSDLPLATPESIRRLTTAGDSSEGVAVAPGRGGGTNALVVRHLDFRVDYHGVSFRDHLRAAEAVGAPVEVVDSFRLSTDVDEADDLVEVLLHGDGVARDWLVDAGFDLRVNDGRVGVRRE